MPSLIEEINIAYAVRYVNFAFAIASIQHCVTTFRVERRVVWRAPVSYATCAFVVSRYIPILGSLLAFIPLGGFQGFSMADSTCGWISCAVIVGTMVSLILSNSLAVWHVAVLWDYSHRIVWAMVLAFGAAYMSSIITLVVLLSRLFRSILWNPILSMCIVTQTDQLILAVSAPPLALELMLFLVICWNTIDRPRSASVPLLTALASDGALSFIIITAIRALHVVLITTGDPGETMLGVIMLSITSTVSATFNLRLLGRKLERSRAVPNRAKMGASLVSLPHSRSQWEAGESIEIGQVGIDVELRKD